MRCLSEPDTISTCITLDAETNWIVVAVVRHQALLPCSAVSSLPLSLVTAALMQSTCIIQRPLCAYTVQSINQSVAQMTAPAMIPIGQ